MKIKIISDGTSAGTRIIDAETGKMIPYVTGFKIVGIAGGPTEVELTMCKAAFEIEKETSIKLEYRSIIAWSRKLWT